jgi:hypothetical protein
VGLVIASLRLRILMATSAVTNVRQMREEVLISILKGDRSSEIGDGAGAGDSAEDGDGVVDGAGDGVGRRGNSSLFSIF